MAVIVGPAPNVGTTGTGTKVGAVQTRDVYGVSIPISEGTRAFEGHIIWSSNTYETQTTTTFPSEIVNGVPTVWGFFAHDVLAVDFAVSFGYHLVPEAERAEVAVFKLWADDQLIYDRSQPTLTPRGYSFVFYDGKSDQNVSPTIAAALLTRGTAFRNQLYIVFTGYPLATADVPSANIVVNGGPTPWRPTHFPLGVLPVIRAEFVDGLTITTGTTDFTMLAGSLLEGNGTIFDWDNDLAYAWGSAAGSSATLHTFDLISQVELSSVPVVGTYTNLDGIDSVALYDFNNKVAVVAKNGVGNTTPIVAIDLQTASIVSTFGAAHLALHPSDSAGVSTLTSGGAIVNIPYPQSGDMAYLLDGQVMRSVAVFSSLFWDVSLLPINDGGTFPLDLGLAESTVKGGAALKLPDGEDISFITCYPFVKLGDNIANEQDGLALVGAGTKVYGIQFGFRQVGGVSRCKVLGYGLIKDYTADHPGYEPIHCVVDPNDRGIIFFLSNGSLWRALKYTPAMYDYYGGSGWGSTGAGFGEWRGRWPAVDVISSIPGYLSWDVSVPPLNTGAGYYNAFRMSNLASDTFAWNNGTTHHIMQLSTGEVNDLAVGVANLADRVWDSRTSQMYFPRGTGANRIMSVFSVGAASSATKTIGEICRWILLYCGYTDAQISIDPALTDPVYGFLLDHPRDLNDLFRDLGETYNFQFFESEGLAKVVRAPQETTSDPGDAEFDLVIDDLCPVQENQVSDNDNLVTVLAGPQQQVATVSLQYNDLDQTFSWQVQSYNVDVQSSGSVATGKLVLDLPIVMHRAEAYRRATKIQTKKNATTDTHYFRLSQAYMQLEPADLVTITKPPFRYGIRIDESTFNGDWSMSFSGSSFLFQDDIEITDVDADGTGDTGRGFGLADAKPLALDIPLLYQGWAGADGTIIMTTGVLSYGQTDFGSAPLVYGPAPIGPFSNVGNFSEDARYGLMVGTLADTLLPFTTDNTTALRIALRTGTVDADWLSTDATGLLEGKNTILVGADGRWEIIYFRDVTKISDKVLTVSGLERGRRGTDVMCGTHQPNDQVILVRSAVTGFIPALRPQTLDDINLAVLLTYDARGIPTVRPRTPITVRVAGLSEYPWAPSEIRAKLGSRYNVVAATSYLNPGGTGDRTALITVTGNYTVASLGSTPSNLVDGATGNNTTDSIDFLTGQTAVVIQFDFRPSGLAQIINEYIWKQNVTQTVGTYAFEGSLDGSAWTTLDAGTNLGGASSTTTVAFANSTAYNYYRLRQTAGSTSSTPWLREIEFKIQADIAANDLLFTWKRRDRLDAGYFVENAVELNDLDEYKFQALLAHAVVHTADDLAVKAYKFTSADQTTAGFSPPLAQIGVKVYQNSSLVGAGFARETTIDVE